MILNIFFKKAYLLPIALIAFSGFGHAAEEKDQYQHKLDTIRSDINNIEKGLDQDKSQRGKLQRELKSIDKKISTLSKEIDYTNFLIKKNNKAQKSLKSELKSIEKSLNIQKQSLEKQLKAAYIMGKHETAKLLLNQQNALEMGHAMIYYQYLNKTRSHQILEYNTMLADKITISADIKARADELTGLKKDQYRQKARFSANRSKRNKLIAQLNNKIVSNEDTLISLQSHRKKIEDLLFSLGEVLADIPTKPADDIPFDTLKGRLPWPVAGRIKNTFGSNRDRSDLVWNGIVLSMDYGAPVHAITRGRVIFSDWLQGYGFITILDHGMGYMSLYGYNQNLLKQVGDWVNAGEVIATVGDSGGQAYSGLYFEIRKQGKPVNPRNWCSIKYNKLSAR